MFEISFSGGPDTNRRSLLLDSSITSAKTIDSSLPMKVTFNHFKCV